MNYEFLDQDAENGPTGRVGGRTPRGRVRERSFAYAVRAIKLYQHLQKQKDGATWVIGKQFLRAACLVGANVEEAQSGESRADFVHKLGIANKEARESLYWLRLLVESQMIPKRQLGPLIGETEDLIRILTSIILTTKRGTRGSGSRDQAAPQA